MGLFTGTADYYDAYRPDVPQAVIDCILQAVPVPISLLDLGTGTGRITEQFAPYFSDIVSVEPDEDMAKIARRRLERFQARVIRATAEDVMLPEGWQASLVTISRAFHWMDRATVVRRLESIVAPGGVVAIFSDESFWGLQEAWAQAVKRVIQQYMGEERRTAMGSYKPPREYFREHFSSSAFTAVATHRVPVVRQWTADQILGYLYSTSFASHAVLGKHTAAFERTVRSELAQLSPADTFTEHNAFDILLVKRP
ncbi:MAG TPA: class I SAM-dependent methyltransferase [Candidatus Saccharimonadales bacterium]|nr:class I SAM-dependent methyltransferase [Candidatus Saccharimonadales bacterium]